MTTLKPDRAALAARLAVADASFGQTIAPAARDYVFVLDDPARGRIVGIAAIKAAVGLDEPFYNFRLGARVHTAPSVDVSVRHDVLYLSHDLTGCAELCSLFLHPDYRSGSNGRLLSKSRCLFIARFPHLFTAGVFAEMRGFQDAHGVSPFWESVGRRFFSMDFARADDLCQPGGKCYIADLMPRYPIYTCLLTDAARAAIGQTHVATAPARRMLEEEGLRAGAYIDIFDGGPVLQAEVGALRAVTGSVPALVSDTKNNGGALPGAAALVCNGDLADFRTTVTACDPANGAVYLTVQQQNALQCSAGCTTRVLSLA